MSALEQSEERREYRRVSDAVALKIYPVDEAANEQDYDGADDLPDHPTHVVSLSPNGLKCYHNENFADGEQFRLSLKLFPGGARIDCKVKVVNAGEEDQPGKSDRFFAGLAFIGLKSESRDELLSHIDGVARQSFGSSVKLVNRG